jgi:tRNA pseudouridine13 synthase
MSFESFAKPYLSSRFPGIGGSIKECPEDFVVEEIPLYLPCGKGEHLYLLVEKQGLTTFDLVRHLARALKLAERDIGYAGLKDARALARQWVSVPRVHLEQLDSLDISGVRIRRADYHGNKLRLGHLAGNRFSIRIRGVAPDALDNALDICHVLEQVGAPNYFGEQRYGALNNSHLIGRALLAKDFTQAAREIIGDPRSIRDAHWKKAARLFREDDLSAALAALPRSMNDERRLLAALTAGQAPREAVLAFSRRKLRLFLSAYQSWLFDRVIAMRMDSLDVLWPGDLAFIHGKGACFLVEQPAAEQERADRFEISPSGPLFGSKARLAGAQQGLLEESLLAGEGLALEAFRLPGGLSMEGARRPLRTALQNPEMSFAKDSLQICFSLERGSYATSVLREIMKTDQPLLNKAHGMAAPES